MLRCQTYKVIKLDSCYALIYTRDDLLSYGGGIDMFWVKAIA